MNNKNELKIILNKRMVEELISGETFEYEEETRNGEMIKVIVYLNN